MKTQKSTLEERLATGGSQHANQQHHRRHRSWFVMSCGTQIGAAMVKLLLESVTFQKRPKGLGPDGEQLPHETAPVFRFENLRGTLHNNGPKVLGVIMMAPEILDRIERSHYVSSPPPPPPFSSRCMHWWMMDICSRSLTFRCRWPASCLKVFCKMLSEYTPQGKSCTPGRQVVDSSTHHAATPCCLELATSPTTRFGSPTCLVPNTCSSRAPSLTSDM